MENFGRYKFHADKTVTNAATAEPVALQELYQGGPQFFRLTNDKGKRERVYLDKIAFPGPDAPKPLKAGKPGKLNMEKAKAIRARLAAGDKVAAIAKDYGVDKSAIYDIKSGRLYNDGSIVYTGKR